jgi:hypothetical protein
MNKNTQAIPVMPTSLLKENSFGGSKKHSLTNATKALTERVRNSLYNINAQQENKNEDHLSIEPLYDLYFQNSHKGIQNSSFFWLSLLFTSFL